MSYGIKTGGRQKGSANKVTRGARDNIMRVFKEIGGVKGFADWAKANRTEFYRHYARLIPVEVGGIDGGPLQVEATWLEGRKLEKG